MTGLIFTNKEETLRRLVSTLEKHGIYVERGQDEDSLNKAISLSPRFVILEFPLWQLTRRDFFSKLSLIWEEGILTIILSHNLKLRKDDQKPFIHVVPPTKEGEERIMEILEEHLGITLELPGENYETGADKFLEKLETGLSHYGVGKLKDAYREWLSVLKMDNCNQKAYEYITIAKQDFEDAGIDLSEFKTLTSMIVEIDEGFELKGRDRYKFVKNPEELEEITLHPFEAFVLSLLDGHIPIREVHLLIPEEKRSCLKYAVYRLLQKGLIEKV